MGQFMTDAIENITDAEIAEEVVYVAPKILTPTAEELIVGEINKFSMLSPNCLLKIREFARYARGSIVEVGSYIGGSSCAMADAVRSAKSQYFIVEAGGAYPDQPFLPTNDILADLKKNLKKWGLLKRVNILEAQAASAAWQLRQALGQNKIGMLFIDADGNSGSIIQCFLPLLADDCLLILDDYSDPDKGQPVRDFIEKASQSGRIEFLSFDDENKSTWFGKIVGSAKDLPSAAKFKHEIGNAFVAFPPIYCEPSTSSNPNASQLQLFEDGLELGAQNALHDDIRNLGGGRFSYWDGQLFFSSSDNSNPNENGRKYEVRFENETFSLN